MKRCFKCRVEKPLTDFYPHPMMADGHLNKCKACARTDSERRRLEKLNDPDWVDREMKRSREKMARSRSEGTAEKPSREQRRLALEKHAAIFPLKNHARLAVGNAVRDGTLKRMPCVVCGSADSEAHHEDYSNPLDVVWLCPKHHAARHVELRRIARRAPKPSMMEIDFG